MDDKNEKRICQNCKQSFAIEPEDLSFYEKIKVPPPTFCVDCREQRRLAFRNERHLYKRKCDLCGKEVVSRVSPDKKYPMYCTNCWWGDKWDPYSYGQEYDFSRPFFEQWRELFFKVPHISIYNLNCVNSDWVNQEADDKNCYLNVGGHYNEDSAYNTYELYGKNSFDNCWAINPEYCSFDIHCERCYFTHFSEECENCLNSILCYDCHNCSNCIACAGLRNKQYCIMNEQYSKEAYEKFIAEYPYSSHNGLEWWKKQSSLVWEKQPHRENFIIKTVNSTGNELSECKNAKNCWQVTKIEDSKNIYIGGWIRDCWDCSCFGAAELVYESAHSGGAYNSKALLGCTSSDPLKKMTIANVEYSYMTTSSSYCFGCSGIRGGEYVILNKKYSKEEYDKLLAKIKKHMNDMPFIDESGKVYGYGEFFPAGFAPHGYNETAACEYFPLSKEEAIERGFVWSDYKSDTTYEFSDYLIPDDIKDVGDDILDKVLKCEETGKAYKIIPMELSFYRKVGLPIPRSAPLARHNTRIGRTLPRKFFKRKCDNCGKEMETPYSPERPEIVYCVECYQKEII